MVVRLRGLPCFVAAVMAVVMCVLAGCKIEGTVDFQADGRTSIALTFEDSDDTMGKIHQTCENFRVAFEAKITFIKNPKVEDITSPGGHLKCKITSNEPFFGNVNFTETKDTYSFRMTDRHQKKSPADFETKIIISMPGKVIKSSVGEVDGNKVTVRNLYFLSHGGVIVSEKNRKTLHSLSSAGESASGRRAEHDDRGVPVWGWAGLGVLAVGAVAAVAVVVVRKRRRALVTALQTHYSDEAAARVGSRYRRYAATSGSQTNGPSSGEDYPPSQAPHESATSPLRHG